jgi:hypothetical protein
MPERQACRAATLGDKSANVPESAIRSLAKLVIIEPAQIISTQRSSQVYHNV